MGNKSDRNVKKIRSTGPEQPDHPGTEQLNRQKVLDNHRDITLRPPLDGATPMVQYEGILRNPIDSN